MKIKNYELDRSLIYEFLLSLFRLENDEKMKLKELELEKEVKLNKEIVNWVEENLSKFPADQRKKLEIFFDEESYFGLCLVSDIPSLNINTVEEYLEKISEMEPALILKKFVESGYGPTEDIELEKIKKLIENEKKAADFVNRKLNFSSSQKWNLLQFFFDPLKMKNDFIELLEWYYQNIFSDQMEWIEKKSNKINDNYQENLNRYGKKYLENILSKFFDDPLEANKVIIAFSYFYESSLLNSLADSGENFFLIGYRFPEIFAGDEEGLLGSLEIFKALADETRLNIISLLAEKTMYGNELAEKLNLSNATISHHVSKLLINNIIKAQKEDNKLYFKLNKKELQGTVLKAVENLL